VKFPRDFVERWPAFREAADALATLQDELAPVGSLIPTAAALPSDAPEAFNPKSDDPYDAIVAGGIQHRTRNHERLVKSVGYWLSSQGATVSTPHPIDLRISSPFSTTIEAKIVGGRNPLFAVREAVSQLWEYQYFKGPRDADLCILLDSPPPFWLTEYVESHLHMFIAWWNDEMLEGGPVTSAGLIQRLQTTAAAG
jgi:hypothetical protein